MDAQKDFYSPDEVAELLDLHVRTIRRYIREARLKATRIGKQYRIAAGDLEAFAGSAHADAAGGSVVRHRRALVSTTVDIDAISPEETYRITNAIGGAFTANREGGGSKRIDSIYYEEQGKLRIIINAELETANAILGLISFILRDGASR